MTYATERNSLGHLVIRCVPIFMDCQRDGLVFDRNWVNQAVVQAKKAASDGYLPPLHVHHHGTDNPVEPAGFFEVTHAEEIDFRGKRRLAVFADLTITNEGVEWDVLQARLPYRSVEILSAERPNIDSLALLNHSAPYLEFPMLMVTDPGPRQDRAANFALATIAQHYRPEPSRDADGVVACFQRGTGATLLFDQREDIMAAKKKTTDKPDTDLEKKTQTAPRVAMADEGDKADDDDTGEDMSDGSGIDVAAICKAIESGEISVADMDAIVAAIGAQKTDGSDDAGVSDPTAVEAQIPGAAMSKEQNVQFARLQARHDALEAKVQAREQADKQRDDVAEAMKRLEGKPLGADLEGRLNKFHKEHGPESFAAYVDETDANFAAFEGDLDSDLRKNTPAPHSKAVDKYAEDGPEAVAKAAKFSAMWKQVHAAGHTRMTEDRYVELNMAR